MVDEEGGLETAGTGRACCVTHTLQQWKENLGRDGGGEGEGMKVAYDWHMAITRLSHDPPARARPATSPSATGYHEQRWWRRASERHSYGQLHGHRHTSQTDVWSVVW